MARGEMIKEILILVNGSKIVLMVMVYMSGVMATDMKENGDIHLDMDKVRTILQMAIGLLGNIYTESLKVTEPTNGLTKTHSQVSL